MGEFTSFIPALLDHHPSDAQWYVSRFMLNNNTTSIVLLNSQPMRAFVSCIGSGEIVVIDLSNPANRHEAGAVPVGGQPWHGTFSADGATFYVGNLSMNKFDVINPADLSFQSIGAGNGSEGLAEPHGVEIHPDGSRLFISERNTRSGYRPYYAFGDNAGTGVVIRTADHSIEKVIEIENFGAGMRLRQK